MQKVLSVAAVWFFAVQAAISQNWVLTNSGTNDWSCIASSANGGTLIAGQYPGCLGVSTNGGATWTTNVMTNGYWASVASSADGTKLLAAVAPSLFGIDPNTCAIFTSTNFGASWVSNSLPTLLWDSVAISADGNTIAAVAESDTNNYPVCAVFCSTNSGTTWVSNNIDFNQITYTPPPAISVAMSADGRKIFVEAPPELCCSTNSGASWMQVASAPPTLSWVVPSQVIASSADGNKLVMCVGGNLTNNPDPAFIYTSTNSGETWNLTSAPGTDWGFVASSANGEILLASANSRYQNRHFPIYISTNSGGSWIPSGSPTNDLWAGVACSADGGALFAIAASDPNLDANSGAIYASQSIQPPLINIAPTGSQLELSWLIPSTNFVLEESPDLYNWTEVTDTPALNPANLEDQIMVPATNGAGFYRLATP